jgi:hypothetical protein
MPSPWIIYVLSIAIALVILIIALALYYHFRPHKAQLPPFDALDSIHETKGRRRFRYKLVSTEAELYKVNELVHDRFGDRTPTDANVLEIFKRNNRKSIVLAELGTAADKTKKVEPIGFASIWPICPNVGKRMSNGELDEDYFNRHPEAVLSQAHNRSAVYLYVTGIAVKGALQRAADIDTETPRTHVELSSGRANFVDEKALRPSGTALQASS